MDNGKKIGFIGFGNMAQAIAKGLLESKGVQSRATVCLCRTL